MERLCQRCFILGSTGKFRACCQRYNSEYMWHTHFGELFATGNDKSMIIILHHTEYLSWNGCTSVGWIFMCGVCNDAPGSATWLSISLIDNEEARVSLPRPMRTTINVDAMPWYFFIKNKLWKSDNQFVEMTYHNLCQSTRTYNEAYSFNVEHPISEVEDYCQKKKCWSKDTRFYTDAPN